ncbi:Phenylacetic acid catabolic protein [Alicyclobacillus pomorum]|jgi:ring-1,2-phenylacetyl-CoA epoxidase subunit PaaC|uniref:Phenylacetic acid catabolic protein n=1 Tax=Alicyclobacillus pomorum TaxID=204470 RepID=UPI0003FB5EB4|nr:Phenylacetic acid catabolic protein [Alicyclobacillus pomorum]
MDVDTWSWVNVLEALADNKFVLGDQLVEVGISAPELQSALAAVAIAQGELGHARHLYHWSHELQGIDKDVAEESGNSLPILQFHENWIELMVSVLGLNVATKVVLDYLRQVGGAAVVQKTTKMLDEMDEHITFATEWCRRFRHETGAIPRLYEESVTRLVREFSTWLHKIEQQLRDVEPPDLTGLFCKEMESKCSPLTTGHPA